MYEEDILQPPQLQKGTEEPPAFGDDRKYIVEAPKSEHMEAAKKGVNYRRDWVDNQIPDPADVSISPLQTLKSWSDRQPARQDITRYRGRTSVSPDRQARMRQLDVYDRRVGKSGVEYAFRPGGRRTRACPPTALTRHMNALSLPKFTKRVRKL